MPEAPATPKQVAYLEFMGVLTARALTKSEAGKKIEAIGEACSSDPFGRMDQRRGEWRTEKFRLHLDLYRADLLPFVMLSEDSFRNHVRARVVGASGKLTKAKVEGVVRALLEGEPLWWDAPDANERFFQGLAAMFPECVDGTAPARAERQVELQPLPPIHRGPRSPRATRAHPVRGRKRGGCAGAVVALLALGAGVVLFALG